MALGSPGSPKYNNLCPIFDYANGGGVLFPYFPMSLGQSASNLSYIDLDGGSLSAAMARVRLPMAGRLITCEAWAVKDDSTNTKAAAASTEPILAITYGTFPLASVALGTQIALISCDLTGDIGHKWSGTTTATDIKITDEIIIYLQAAAASATSANKDGGAVPVLWFAAANSPE